MALRDQMGTGSAASHQPCCTSSATGTTPRERRKLMQVWADHLDKLFQGAKGIPLQAA
jgi:hypothetical protein